MCFACLTVTLLRQDCTPFEFTEEYTAVDHFGEQLRAAGYNYYGNEVWRDREAFVPLVPMCVWQAMYSGVLGTELRCDIFIGVVYYQRLRHMVKDKFQVCVCAGIPPSVRPLFTVTAVAAFAASV